MWLNNVLETIGNTPLIRLNKLGKEFPCTVLAKVDYFNPGNSIKDRMALKMVEVAEQEGKLKPGGTIIEGTSGNTGMGLALAACVKGYHCIFVTTDKQSKEKVDILKALGAEVIVCPTNVLPQDPRSYYSVAKRLAQEIPNSMYMNQYDNLANRQAHYESTGPEIWEQTEGKITHLVCTAGTGGTITGTAMYLKEKNPNIQIWAIDVYGSLLTKYYKTGEIDMNEVHPYISEGFGEDFVPGNYDMRYIDHFEQVTDKDGAVMARRIAREEGLFCGYSAGSCLQGLMQLKDRLKKDDLVVCIFHDHGTRYIGKIYNDQWMMERGFLEVKTFKDIVNGRRGKSLLTLDVTDTVANAVEMMKKYNIEQIPLTKEGNICGAVSENGLFQKVFSNPDIRHESLAAVAEAPYPVVPFETPVEKLGQLINKENGAVLAKDEKGEFHIVTKYDVIQTLAQ
ncbi:MAG: pyridoxal-phosphate dependent enzyme [Chitinophagaceae bacterium]|jgi:cystathionine beta-synthase|nr:pyridoxal-phosphate dependent enzyme [Chitinophagaceae bacterium]MCA6469570.1 pyridoxal-phosphate dependent enzyme [Chitinophagaceae bacterium]MCA6476510.1 pyridoxal-phosphate dependent enzyme [Chitinophagaceae bacterium]MCA6479985.1 pyridoxal-phosphate dependent enzyme [Chitinophagaceae bacterium]MCA6497735.1 pyridoxal-phosphate dependent enzyme [Chitinophagaceae bacterium]